MEIFTKNSAKCTIFQRNECNNFSSLMMFAIFAIGPSVLGAMAGSKAMRVCLEWFLHP
jgi:hypothetical protein